MNDRSFIMGWQMSSDKPTVPETKRDKAVAQRRKRILAAAMACFLENGYHQTGVRDIAKRAGVSLGNLYNHFPGKHDILAEIAALERRELAPIIEVLSRPDPANVTLEAFITAYARYLAKPENAMLTIEIASEAVRKHDIGTLFMTNRNELVRALEAVILRGIDDGSFRSVPDANETAQLIIELIEGGAYRSVLGNAGVHGILGGLKDFIFSALWAG